MAAAQSLPSPYGLAVDLGTTNISVSLWDLEHGERLASRVGSNPQSHYGSDVVMRLIAAGESAENAARIRGLPSTPSARHFWRCAGASGLSPAAVSRHDVVGNTSMLALLTETDSRILLQPGSWTRPIDCRPHAAQAGLLGWESTPRRPVEVVPPCGGFVGSDLLAGVLATRLTDLPGGLLVDFGTNSEMALWDGGRLWVTSAAGGPAFDGYQLRCGMPAEAGAVYRVDRPGGHLVLRVTASCAMR